MLKIGIAGVGFMGWIHYHAYRSLPGVRVAAFSSRRESRRHGDWTDVGGNFGPPGERIDVTEMNTHETVRQLIDDPDVDVVDVCLPTPRHADVVRESLEAGKRVLCEKPLTLGVAEARHLAELAATNDAIPRLLVAQILPFMTPYQYLLDVVSTGRLGTLTSIRTRRYVSPPDWTDATAESDPTGGPVMDLHVHDAHLLTLLLGRCEDLTAHVADGRYEVLATHAGGVASSGGGVVASPVQPFAQGYEAMFERGTIRFDLTTFADGAPDATPVTVTTADGRVERPDLGNDDITLAFGRELAAAVVAFTGGDVHPALTVDNALAAIETCRRIDPGQSSG